MEDTSWLPPAVTPAQAEALSDDQKQRAIRMVNDINAQLKNIKGKAMVKVATGLADRTYDIVMAHFTRAGWTIQPVSKTEKQYHQIDGEYTATVLYWQMARASAVPERSSWSWQTDH